MRDYCIHIYSVNNQSLKLKSLKVHTKSIIITKLQLHS